MTIKQDEGIGFNNQNKGLVEIKQADLNYYTDMYEAGQTKQRLKIGREVEGNIENNIYTNIYYYSGTTTGNWSYTGVGFKPKYVRIQAYLNVSPNGGISDGSSYGNYGACTYDYYSSGWNKALNDARILYITNNGNTTRKIAQFISFDDDGFTLNFTSNNSDGAIFFITCF